MNLLSRDQFKIQVFARSKGKCVLCMLKAVDAHHIFERKLYEDGGYYLANGAAVCEEHHLRCETTQITVAQVRLAAGITENIVPPGFSHVLEYDKWGNMLRLDGMREPGPLFDDPGCKKALAMGGFLGCFVPKGTP